MLGILLIFFIGKYFYELAQDYYKHRWLYAVIGIITYYAAGAIFGVILGVSDLLFDFGIDWESAYGLELTTIPIGIAADYFLYRVLKKKWQNEAVIDKDEIQDIGKNVEEIEEN